MNINKKQKNKDYNREILGIIIITFGILSAISLFSYKTGIIGTFLRNTFFTFFGFGGYIFPIIVIAIGLLLIINKFDIRGDKKSIYILIIFLCFITLINIKNHNPNSFTANINESIEFSKEGLGGGIVGSIFGYAFFKLFGSVGSYIIISLVIMLCILLFTEIKIKDIFLESQS